MSKTMAEHARAYRTRKAEKMARMEAALREIANAPRTFQDTPYGVGYDAAVIIFRGTAREALATKY